MGIYKITFEVEENCINNENSWKNGDFNNGSGSKDDNVDGGGSGNNDDNVHDYDDSSGSNNDDNVDDHGDSNENNVDYD